MPSQASAPSAIAPARARRAQRRRPAATPGPAWLLVVHPNAEVAAGRADLVRLAFPSTRVRWSTRGCEALAGDALLTGDGAALVHVDGVDRFHAAWAGHRVLTRLAAQGRPAIAWVAADDRDGRALALRSGARDVVWGGPQSGRSAVDRVVAIRTAIRSAFESGGVPAAPLVDDDEFALAAWFMGRYGMAWQPWMEHAIAVMMGGGERTEQADVLRRVLAPTTNDQALRRLRQVTEALCGEIRGNEAVLRREALVVLRRIARHRPIEAEPFVIRSLQRAARLLVSDPQLAVEAGLSGGEVDDLVEVAAAEVEANARPVRRRGRPEAGAWRLRRDLALGRVAERRGLVAAEKIEALNALRISIDATLDAVYDALEDRERPVAA